MKRYIKRLALPLGAAVVLGTAGFAYMASNTVATAGLGEGYSPVAGYTVTNIGFNDNPNLGVGSNCGGNNGCGVASVQFHLASQGAPTTQAYQNAPNFVFTSLLNSGNVSVANSGLGGAGQSDCHIVGAWANGQADYTCTMHGTGNGGPDTLNNVASVDVAANQ